jgi:hypothetical protein
MRLKQQSLIRWDRKDKRLRVKQLADSQGMKINRFVNWLADMALAQQEAEARFRAAASKGNPKHAIRILEALDRADARSGIAGSKP